ncbi:MAG: hypothetical protein RRZ93_07155, partial [Ruthenibacterium sp.]
VYCGGVERANLLQYCGIIGAFAKTKQFCAARAAFCEHCAVVCCAATGAGAKSSGGYAASFGEYRPAFCFA